MPEKNEYYLGPDHSTLAGGVVDYVAPDICIVCDGLSNPGAHLEDSITGKIEKYCWECHNMTLKIRREQQ